MSEKGGTGRGPHDVDGTRMQDSRERGDTSCFASGGILPVTLAAWGVGPGTAVSTHSQRRQAAMLLGTQVTTLSVSSGAINLTSNSF